MGTFLRYVGDTYIPEEKRAEFIERAQKVLYYGGMMGTAVVPIYGKKIPLLCFPDSDGNSYINCIYNYFENDFWGTAGIASPKPYVFSSKVGGGTFNFVCRALYVLQEFYTKEFGLYVINGKLIPATAEIGWLNYLFDERFANKRLSSPWHVLRVLHIEDDLVRLNGFGEHKCPYWLDDNVSSASLLSYLASFNPDIIESTFDANDSNASNLSTQIGKRNAMRKALQEIVDDPTEDAVNKFDKLKSILASQQKAIEVCENDSSESYRTFAIAFSEEMQAWLSEQKRALDEIAVDGSAIETREDFLEIFVGALDDMNILDCRIFMFMDTFYEFLMDWRNIKKQAAIKLLQRLLDKLDSQEEEDEIKESVKWIRRALAVLANPELRRKVWGF